MEPKNEQTQKNQASNEAAKSLQPKKTWIEPELVSMGVESGQVTNGKEWSFFTNVMTNGSLSS